MTVEALQASFEKVDRRIRAIVEAGKSDGAVADCIRKAWEDQFHTGLSTPAVKGLTSHYRAVVRARRTRKARGQVGGMAPLDYTLGQGITAPVYGRFPVEMGTQPDVVRSLDRFYENPISRGCDSTGGFPAPQQGGGLWDAVTAGHMPASVPRNILETAVSTLQGRPIANPPASPISATVPGVGYTPTPYPVQAINQITELAPIAPTQAF